MAVCCDAATRSETPLGRGCVFSIGILFDFERPWGGIVKASKVPFACETTQNFHGQRFDKNHVRVNIWECYPT